ncbi:3-phosphoserine/phosphohydroxythreonine transaminase [Bacillus lacus]|uniref:Phosphoserine aminotransferase n=1 Tax=Metabacillus lacus TaxID=1983721 RepID=A0A7X2IXU8_9BACI|nr:3-phosphoserine/phosphohydroxythreonine transaminase [Metabacillus lacus]MRX71457.1 3-phosphoserine/phosphohydroxythreonine transaminase [Metabacillus lacus]
MFRSINFNAGPAALPQEVILKAQEELFDYHGTGMSIMEMSHRSKEFHAVHVHAQSMLREIMDIPDTHEVLFMQGGASHQFAMVPMNFLHPGQTAHYILTGTWAEKALQEAASLGSVDVLASTKETGYRSVPAELSKKPLHSAYTHITSNNTIYGTQWQSFPEVEDRLIADMSSDIMSRKIDVSKFSLIYAGAQKNLGPSGVTVVIADKDFLGTAQREQPKILQYKTFSDSNSLYNTPPTFSIYMLALVLEWTLERGGIHAIEKANNEKAQLLYHEIDSSEGFYEGHAEKGSRSQMNVTFRLPSEDLTAEFLKGAAAEGMVGLPGHRSVGGCRASIYNAVPITHCEALAEYMEKFRKKN